MGPFDHRVAGAVVASHQRTRHRRVEMAIFRTRALALLRQRRERPAVVTELTGPMSEASCRHRWAPQVALAVAQT
jgi:hypothetical protein